MLTPPSCPLPAGGGAGAAAAAAATTSALRILGACLVVPARRAGAARGLRSGSAPCGMVDFALRQAVRLPCQSECTRCLI